jgi:hypothetical protein
MRDEDGEKVHKTDIDDLVEKVSPRLLIMVAGGAVAVALFAMMSMLIMISVSSDISTLQDQIRKAGKTAKAMQEEMAELRTLLAPAVAGRQAEGAQGSQSTQGAQQQSYHPAAPTVANDKQVRIDTGGASRDCSVKSGDASGLAACLKLAPLS